MDQTDDTLTMSLQAVRDLAKAVLIKAGMNAAGSDILADIVTKSERDGPRSHGLRMLPAYAQSFSSGYANPDAYPRITQPAPGVMRADGDNGYFQIAAETGRAEFIDLARRQGIAAFTCANCHHLAGMRFDTEPLAEAGLVAIGAVNSLSMVVPHGGRRPVFGTNPMSFACPRASGPPIVWDQASSVVALMDVRMAAAEGKTLPIEGGLDTAGKGTKDPTEILETRALLPFGDHKGSAIAFMVEVLCAALAGGTLALDNAERERHEALNIKGGVTLIAINPEAWGNAHFDTMVARICGEIDNNGDARVPGDGRLVRRATAEKNGVKASRALVTQLEALR
ncbi:MAG: Ldh family oxidoreductase [Pseudomonadota bacterium]